MPPLTTGQFSGLLAPDLRRVYVATGKERPLEYPMVLNTDRMEWNPVTDRIYSGLGTLAPMPEGDRFTQDQATQGPTKTYAATAFGLAVEITYQMWRDDLYGYMREIIAGLARASRNRLEVSAW